MYTVHRLVLNPTARPATSRPTVSCEGVTAVTMSAAARRNATLPTRTDDRRPVLSANGPAMSAPRRAPSGVAAIIRDLAATVRAPRAVLDASRWRRAPAIAPVAQPKLTMLRHTAKVRRRRLRSPPARKSSSDVNVGPREEKASASVAATRKVEDADVLLLAPRRSPPVIPKKIAVPSSPPGRAPLPWAPNAPRRVRRRPHFETKPT
mmetsp:Transcript_4608/g.18958  ORF Transcript_4608/g.18958 Transcript_4608/m.18958 type:complete len:207 (+) Transcript_4608:1188-1808(+)